MQDPVTKEIVTDSCDIARVLTTHWQSVFDHKYTDPALRAQWLQRLAQKMDVTMEMLTPTLEDVESIFDNLPSSSPGPDGLSFSVFKKFKEILVPMFLSIVRGMLDGSAVPPQISMRPFSFVWPRALALASMVAISMIPQGPGHFQSWMFRTE